MVSLLEEKQPNEEKERWGTYLSNPKRYIPVMSFLLWRKLVATDLLLCLVSMLGESKWGRSNFEFW